MLNRTLLLLFIVLTSFSFAQKDSSSSKLSEHVRVYGYLKYLHSANFVDLDAMTTNNLFHNRFNLEADWNNFEFVAGMRNRIFYGDMVTHNPFLEDALEQDNGYADLSFVWGSSSTVMAHTVFDRVYLRYTKNNLEVTAGRQRINWGVNLAWNTNDLFNTYNFTDFDYEERPGNDAIRTLYYLNGGMSSIEAAYKPGESGDETILAARYLMNKRGYDIQFIGGWYYTDLALGLGWAGNLKSLGFKGEGTYFIPRDSELDSVKVLNLSSSIDYSFGNGLYLNGSVLFNSNGIDDVSTTNLLTVSNTFSNITAKTLMPTKYSGFLQASYPITPLFNASLAGMYGSHIHLVFLMPSLGYSIATTWDLSLVGQIYFAEIEDDFQPAGSSLFLRLKWSF
jgi:hypothetical protein